MSRFLTSTFFERDVWTVARALIGVELVWEGCTGIIVETEAYAAQGDPACHTATRPTTRQFMAERPPGAAYVYFNYGMYWMFNLLVKGSDAQGDGLVLIRALEPRRGLATMQERRGKERLHDLCSGPGKLAMALGIEGAHHGLPLVGRGKPAGCGLRAPSAALEVVADVRVGISQAADYPWRFLVPGHPHVSVPLGKVKPAAIPVGRKGAPRSERRD